MLPFLFFLSSAWAQTSDQITYEWLTKEHSSYTDHLPHFKKLFEIFPVRTFFECGCGFSTKYFLEHADRVISVDFMSDGTSEEWYQTCLKLFGDHPRWVPSLYYGSANYNEACRYQCVHHEDYAWLDPRYLEEIDLFLKTKLTEDVDVGFVDTCVYIRGDFVNLLMKNGVPIVVAHDTKYGYNAPKGLYGWFKIAPPPEYETIYIPAGQGTTFWIHRRLPQVIQSMIEYRDSLPAN